MTNCTVDAPARKTKATTRRCATETSAVAFQRTALELPKSTNVFDVLDRMTDISGRWWSIIDNLLETHLLHDKAHPEPLEPLPDWAVKRLQDRGRHDASEEEFSRNGRLLKDWLHLAAGDGSQYRYEVWTSRGSRLAFKHESWQQAAAVAEQLKTQFPDAFVAQVHTRAVFGVCTDDPALLDTMIGRITHIGTSFAGKEEKYTVCDATGRQVTVPATTLRQHSVYERLDKQGKEALDFYLASVKPRRDAALNAAEEQEQ